MSVFLLHIYLKSVSKREVEIPAVFYNFIIDSLVKIQNFAINVGNNI